MRLATIKHLSMALVFVAISSVASSNPVAPRDIYVVDSDTIDVHGQRIRLIDFDAPELGGHAH
jgi:endonuclease YncB( thermonuclease family)